MKKLRLFLISLFLMFDVVYSITSNEILKKVDEIMNAPQDQKMNIKIILIDKNGNEKIRALQLFQKKGEKKLVKFTAPADQKGIGVLSLPNEVMYLYLPAYKKVRRIASHVKNNKFAGTDFAYEDMESKKYSVKWNSRILNEDNSMYVIELTPGKDTVTGYSKVILNVRKEDFYPVRIEYYDKAEKLYKILINQKIDKIKKYIVAKEMIMENIQEKHKTRMIVEEIEFDTGIPDEIFTERYLSR